MKELIIVLSNKDKEALGTVRCFPALQVAEQEGQLWVRGIEANENIALPIRQLPTLHSYQLDAQNNLFPVGGLTPVGRLEKLVWKPISTFIRPELPTSALPGKVTTQYSIKLVPAQPVEKGSALLTDLSVWKEYADSAPQIRLDQLRFAVSEHNQVLILGSPLPPIPGMECWLRNGIVLPNGYDFELPLVADLLGPTLNPRTDSVVLFDKDGNWEKISLNYLMPATRSAVRLTKGTVAHD